MRLRGGRARGSLISIPGQLCPLSRASHPFSTDSIHLFRGSPFRKTTPLFATVLCRSFDLLTKGFSRERERGRKVCVSLFLSKAYSRSFRPVASLGAVYPASRVYHIRAPCSRARVYLVLHTTAVRDCVPCGERRSWHFRDTLRPEELPRALVGTFGINVMAPSVFAILCFVPLCCSIPLRCYTSSPLSLYLSFLIPDRSGDTVIGLVLAVTATLSSERTRESKRNR